MVVVDYKAQSKEGAIETEAYLENQYDQVYNKFKEEGILDSRFLLSPTILRTVGEVTKENRDQLARQMVEAYTANQLLHNVETLTKAVIHLQNKNTPQNYSIIV